MDIATFVKVGKALPANISVLIRGGHGIGKSETVHQLAEEFELPLIDRRMSQMTEGDVIGLPKLEDGVTRFIPAEFIKQACDRPVMLFLDEINRATTEVMNACFQLCLDRELNGNKLHPGTRVYAAINASAQYQVNEMDPAFLDRFHVVDLSPTAKDFFDYAEGTDKATGKPRIDPDMLRFLRERETRLDPSVANPGTITPSRRSWVRLDKAYAANNIYAVDLEKNTSARAFAYSLAVGFVGLEAASDFTDYLAKRETRFNAEHVYNEYPEHRAKIAKLGQDKLNTLIDLCVEFAKTNLFTDTQSANLGDFVKDLPGELRVAFITSFTKATRPLDTFAPNFKSIHGTVIPHIVAVFNDKENEGAAAEASKPAESKPAKATKKKK